MRLKQPIERLLTPDEESELDELLHRALACVPIDPSQQEAQGALVVGLHMWIEHLRDNPADDADKVELLSMIGVLWGEELCRVANWDWCVMEMPNGFVGTAVVDDRRARICFPIQLANGWVNIEQVNRCMLLFTELCRRDHAELDANGYYSIG